MREFDVLQNAWSIAGVALSVVMGALTPWVWRRVGPTWGLRYVAVALLPAGLALSGTLTLIGRLSRSIGSFFTNLVFSPSVWFGFGLITLAVALVLVSRSDRVPGGAGTPKKAAPPKSTQKSVGRSAARIGAPPSGSAPSAGGGSDDEFADIEEILRRRGIT